MDDKKLTELRETVARMRQELASLTAEAGDYPALERNAARISANLAMMEITLGMDNSALD